MNTSPTIAHIAPALIKAQATIGAASKDAKNPFYSSTYADLGSVMAVCKEPLLAQGISILQPLSTRDNGDIILATMLLHESGEFISSEMKITPPKRMVCPKSDKEKFEPYLAPDPQAEGSAITYARRYSLQALVGIPSVDDDAEWAERALSRRPLTQETAEKLGTAVDQTIAAADATTDEAERQRLHKEAMKLEKGIQQRTPEAIAIAEYEEKNPEHRNKVACATQDEKGNWTFTLVGGEKPKTTRTRKATPAPAETQQEPARTEQGMGTPWREFICLRGPAGGMMNGNTLEKIFVTGHMAPNSPQKLDRLMAWFPQESIPTSSDPHDKVLWAKVQEAEKELRAKFATGSPATQASTQTTTAPTKPAQQAASPTDWRNFEIPGKNVAFSGHKLGDFVNRMLEVKEYADSIDMARANLSQKSFKANVSLAMAELHPSAQPAELPLAANEVPQHTKELLDAISHSKWDHGFFISQCKINGWIAEERRKVEQITEAEFEKLSGVWDQVEAEMRKAHQPEQRV